MNFNGRKHLRTLLESLFKLNYEESKHEIIFVDNGSTDDSVQFVGSKYPAVKVIKNSENSYCKGVNLGIRTSKAKYVALLNSDTKVDKNWLIELVISVEADKKAAAAGSKILTFDGFIQNAGHYELPNFYWGERGAGESSLNYNKEEEVLSLCGAAILYDKAVLVRLGLFDEDFIMYGEDVDMAFRLRKAGCKLVYAPKSIAYHRLHGSGSEEISRYYVERNRLLYIAKHFPTKLSSALVGSGYFTVSRSSSAYGMLKTILPAVFEKLFKEQTVKIASTTIEETLDELQRTYNSESDTLVEHIHKIEKERDGYAKTLALSGNNVAMQQEIASLKRQAHQYRALLSQAKKRHLSQNKQVAITAKQLNDYKKLLEEDKKEVAETIKQYKNIAEERTQQITELMEKLRSQMDHQLILQGKLIEEQFNREQATNIAEERTQQITELMEKLRLQMDRQLTLQGKLAENENQRENIKKQLNNIKNSEGYRFILWPIWQAIIIVRKILSLTKRQTRKTLFFIPSAILTILLTLSFSLEALIWKICGRWLRKTIKKRSNLCNKTNPKISLVMPNHNGVEILKKSLPTIFTIPEFRDGRHEVLVVDDGSTDDSVMFIKKHYPQIRILENKRNMKFGYTCNRAVKSAANNIVVLINNDIMLKEGFLEPLLQELKDDVFAVTPKMYGWDKQTFVWGMHMGRFQDGYIRLWNECETDNGDKLVQATPSIFAIGGAMVFRKEDFIWLKGFDDIYKPNCWEDIDISYRAWKRGLKVSYAPQSLLYHKGRATLTYERHKEIKNELLFIWKNITDIDMVFEHLMLLPRNILEGGTPFIKGLLWAISCLPAAMIHRLLERRYTKRSDRSIFNHCMHCYRNAERRNFKQRPQNEKRNLLLVTSFLPYPLNKGGSIRIHNLVIRLKQKYNVYLLSLINHEDEKKHLDALKTTYKEVHIAHSTPNRITRLFPRRYRYSFSTEMISSLQSIQQEVPLDIVHIESNELFYLLDHVKHLPIAYTEHDSSALFLKDTYYKKNDDESWGAYVLDYLKRVYYHRKAYKKIDRTIVLSDHDRHTMRTFFPGTHFTLIPTGVDLNKFIYTASHKKPRHLMFVGHYLHYPNEEAVIYFADKILPLIQRHIPDVKFFVVGSAPTERIINLQAKDSSIIVTGEVNNVSNYLKDAAVFVNPIRRSWGIKGKVLEAMASGVPVVSTVKGAAGIHVADNQGIVVADSPRTFANSVVKLLQEEDNYARIARIARAITERWYDWDHIIGELKHTYDCLIENRVPEKDNNYFEPLTLSNAVDAANTTVQKILDNTDIYSTQIEEPRELHIELDYKCNSRCIMCDLWDAHKRTDPKKPLTLDEIKEVVEKSQLLKDMRVVVLSGGEPFLRNDIKDIAGYFLKKYPGISLGILTNGIDTERIISISREIIKEYRPDNFWLGSSLDGVGDQHDAMRGVKGAYTSLKKTAAACKRNNIPFTLTFTLTSRNYDQILLASKAAKDMGIELYLQLAVAKDARDKQVFSLSLEQLKVAEKDIYQLIQQKLKAVNINEYVMNPLQEKFRLLSAHLYYLSNLIRYYKHPARYFNQCVAGKRFAMLSPYGELYFCSKLKRGALGSIRTASFDTMWQAEDAKNIRRYIADSLCHCWLVCIIFPVIDEAWKAYTNSNQEKTSYNNIKHIEESPVSKQQAIEIASEDSNTNLEKVHAIQQVNSTLNLKEQIEKTVKLKSYPKIIGIGLHWKCNANCLFCNASQSADPFNFNTYKRLFEKKLADSLLHAEAVNLCGAGELLLLPQAEEFLSYLRTTQPNLLKIITTNGSPLIGINKSVLISDKISLIVSLHASNEKLHQQITGLTNFNQILKAIDGLLCARKNSSQLSIDLKFVANTLNIEDLPNFVELAHTLGADKVLCDYMQIPTAAHAKLSCFFKQGVTNKMLCLAEEKAAELNTPVVLPPKFAYTDYSKHKNQKAACCTDPWEYLYAESEGSVIPCCFAPNHIGYLYKEPFDSIWNGKHYKDLRQSLIDNNPKSTCTFCYKGDPNNVNKLESHIAPSNQALRDQLLRERV